MSARNNIERRQALRKTWLQATNERRYNGICYKFVLGQECDIPPGDRIDPYSCTRWTNKLIGMF